MGDVVVVEVLSLDGVMQSPGRPDEDTRDGFAAGGWAATAMADDPEAATAAMKGQGHAVAMLFGRRTYVDLVGHWLGTDEPNPFTDVIRETPKYVASPTLGEPLEHPNSSLVTGDLLARVQELKDRLEGDLIVLGSGEVARQLAAGGLVDSYVLTIVPVVLGTGTRLFQDTPADLEVTSSFVSPRGVVVLSLAVRRSG